ncbi:protein phosphatase 2A B' alpha [Xanthomonas citri pv. glycines str. 8ra]|nr:protein phosphatase 2A B' alpha [Xanthomonas citri pv. glycines str. 8ra]
METGSALEDSATRCQHLRGPSSIERVERQAWQPRIECPLQAAAHPSRRPHPKFHGHPPADVAPWQCTAIAMSSHRDERSTI